MNNAYVNRAAVTRLLQEVTWVLVGAFSLMTCFAIAPPLYRISHGVPADDNFRYYAEGGGGHSLALVVGSSSQL
jgi:hypothetical protein